MKNKRLLAIGVILLVTVALIAGINVMYRDKIAAGIVELTAGDKKVSITLDDITAGEVKGVRVNGKGEEIEVEGEGILLGTLLNNKGFKAYNKITVISDDSYSAEVSYDEIIAGTEAYIMEDEGEARLVVFGDSNSKRSVSNVKQIVVE